MKKSKWILVLFIILIGLPAYSDSIVSLKDVDVLKFEDIETLMMEENLTIKINQNTKRNLYDAIDSIRDAKADKKDLQDAIYDIEDAIDGLNKAIDGQDEMIKNLSLMLPAENDTTGQVPPLGQKTPEILEDGKIPDLDSGDVQMPVLGPEQIYQSLIFSQVVTLNSVKGLYSANIASLEQNIKSMKNQLDEFEKLPARKKELEKTLLQIDMGNESLIWGAKSLYLGYNNLQRQRGDLIKNLERIEDQIDIMVIQKALGMLTSLEIKELEKQRQEIILAIKTVDAQLDNILGDLNLMLNQDFNKLVILENGLTIDEKSIEDIKYEEDLKIVKENSHSLEIKEYDLHIKTIYMDWENDYGEYKDYKTAKREFENASNELKQEDKNIELIFFKAYQELKDKTELLHKEKENLEFEKEKYDILELKYKLGLVSRLEIEQARSQYNSQNNKFKSVEQDLFQKYLQYEELLKGKNFIQ